MSILHVISSLHYHGAATQLALLAPRLRKRGLEVSVAVLGVQGPMSKPLMDGGVPVQHLGWRRLIDLRPFWLLRQQVRDRRPDLIHVWGLPALRTLALTTVGLKRRPPIVASMVVGPQSPGQGDNLDRWLLGRATRILVTGPALAERCRRLGIPPEKTTVIPPAVEVNSATEWPGPLPVEGRFIACVGPIEPSKGFLDAVWAFDILRYLYSDLHMLVIGAGSDVPRLRRFVATMDGLHQVHLLGLRADTPALLRQAEVVWVPSRTAGGVNVTLEALAAGKPVVAARLPELAEIITDNEAGFLVTPGDKVALARQTRVLLEESERRRRLGEAGKQRVLSHFNADDVAGRMAETYRSLS